MFAQLKSILRDQLGASLVEYALMLSLVAVTCLFGLNVLGANAKTQMSQNAARIGAVESGQSSNSGNRDGNGNDDGSRNGNGSGNNNHER